MAKTNAEKCKDYRERKAKKLNGKTEIRGAHADPKNHDKWKKRIKLEEEVDKVESGDFVELSEFIPGSGIGAVVYEVSPYDSDISEDTVQEES